MHQAHWRAIGLEGNQPVMRAIIFILTLTELLRAVMPPCFKGSDSCSNPQHVQRQRLNDEGGLRPRIQKCAW